VGAAGDSSCTTQPRSNSRGTCATLARSQYTHGGHFANLPGAFQPVMVVAKVVRPSMMAAIKVCWPQGSLQASLPAQHAAELP
jgi:hypothetical protein